MAIQLTSSNPQALQVPANITITEGNTTLEVEFATLADTCRTVRITAFAAGFVFDGSLDIILYRKPNLQWPGTAPTVSLCQPRPFEAFADCLPENLSRVWWVISNAESSSSFILTAMRASTSSHYTLEVKESDKEEFAKARIGTWELRVQVMNRLIGSDPIQLEIVGIPVSGSLSSPNASLFDVCQSTTQVNVQWHVTAVQAIRLLLDGNTLYTEGSSASPLTDPCTSISGAQWVNVPTNGASLGSEKQIILQGLSFDSRWQSLATLSLSGFTNGPNPCGSAFCINSTDEILHIYTTTISLNRRLLGYVEVSARGTTEVPLPDCLPLIVWVFTENPPEYTWPPAGFGSPPWDPANPQWILQWFDQAWKVKSRELTKVAGGEQFLLPV